MKVATMNSLSPLTLKSCTTWPRSITSERLGGEHGLLDVIARRRVGGLVHARHAGNDVHRLGRGHQRAAQVIDGEVSHLADVLPTLARGVAVQRDIPALLPATWKAARLAAQSATKS